MSASIGGGARRQRTTFLELPAWLAGVLSCALWGVFGGDACVAAADHSSDPLNSPVWSSMQQRFFKDQHLIFDERVRVAVPKSAEDPLDVAVTIDAPELGAVREIMVIADLNPIQKILSFKPVRAQPSLSFRFKVEQSTPVRAAMLVNDVWHIGGVWLSATGGGCTTPSGASRGLWQGQVGAMNGRLWDRGAVERLRLRIVHPMDTGLASGIPAFYMDHLVIRNADGADLAILDTFEPLAENPVLSLDLLSRGPVRVAGHDIQGNTFAADIQP